MPEIRCGFDDIAGGASGIDLLVHYGPTVWVDVGFDPDYEPNNPDRAIVPKAGLKGVAALVDTGATECCIDSMLATELNLPIVDVRTTAGVGGALEVNMHLAQVYVPGLNYTVWGQFAGVHLAAGGQEHRVLLGRTFLKPFELIYRGNTGTVIIRSL